MARPSESSPDTPPDVMEQIHTLMHALKARVMRGSPEAGGRRVAPTEARILHHVARHPGSTQGDLVERTGRDKGQINRLIQQVEDAGLLVRVPDETDRRKLRLELTAEGREVVKGIAAERRKLSAKLVADFTPEEREQLAALLARLQKNLGD
jgi:DNA-binding MarR family transcriptional regulator